jgi:hypothetical protein
MALTPGSARHATTRGRAVLGFAAGVGLFVLLAVGGVVGVVLSRKGAPHGGRYIGSMALAVASVGGVSFALISLLLLPLMWWLNRLRRLDIRWAAALGGLGAAVMMLGAVAVIGALTLNRYGGLTPERYGLFLSQSWGKCLVAVLFGALAGALAWRVAYRRSVDVTKVF